MKKSPLLTLGEMLSQRRNQVGMTQSTLAQELGHATAQFVSNWERGIAPVPPKSFRKLSQLLGVPMREMIDHACRDHRRELIRKVKLS